MVDEMVENRKNPLFQRVYSKITVLSFNRSEIVQLYSYFGITDPNLMLSLHSIFGGNPFPYRTASSAQLLRGNDTNLVEVIHELSYRATL